MRAREKDDETYFSSMTSSAALSLRSFLDPCDRVMGRDEHVAGMLLDDSRVDIKSLMSPWLVSNGTDRVTFRPFICLQLTTCLSILFRTCVGTPLGFASPIRSLNRNNPS